MSHSACRDASATTSATGWEFAFTSATGDLGINDSRGNSPDVLLKAGTEGRGHSRRLLSGELRRPGRRRSSYAQIGL